MPTGSPPADHLRSPPDPRPRCSVFIAVSVDGFIARMNGALDWLNLVERPGEDYGYAQFAASVDTIAVGRKTYETVLGFPEWPYTGKRVVVLSHGLVAAAAAPRCDETFFAGNPRELVARLGRQGARHIYVDGGATIRAFLAEGLVDDLTLSVIPIVLSAGVPLFGDLGGERRLELEAHTAFPSGLVQVRYRIADAERAR